MFSRNLITGDLMLNINIICVGKIKEKYLKDAIEEYSKRLSKYCKLTIKEITDEPIPSNLSNRQAEIIKNSEGAKILDNVKNDYMIALDLSGKEYSSENFSQKLDNLTFNNSSISFVIGGSLGLSTEVIHSANELICFSKMTFPHQLIRVFLLEQIYRAFKISNNETYHR